MKANGGVNGPVLTAQFLVALNHSAMLTSGGHRSRVPQFGFIGDLYHCAYLDKLLSLALSAVILLSRSERQCFIIQNFGFFLDSLLFFYIQRHFVNSFFNSFLWWHFGGSVLKANR